MHREENVPRQWARPLKKLDTARLWIKPEILRDACLNVAFWANNQGLRSHLSMVWCLKWMIGGYLTFTTLLLYEDINWADFHSWMNLWLSTLIFFRLDSWQPQKLRAASNHLLSFKIKVKWLVDRLIRLTWVMKELIDDSIKMQYQWGRNPQVHYTSLSNEIYPLQKKEEKKTAEEIFRDKSCKL